MIRNAALAFVLLAGTAHAQGAGAGIVGTAWLVEDIAGRGVIDSAQTTLSFDTAGRVSGSGGCNRFTGAATLAGEALTVGLLAATRLACVPALMDQEQKFFKAIEAVRSYLRRCKRIALPQWRERRTAVAPGANGDRIDPSHRDSHGHRRGPNAPANPGLRLRRRRVPRPHGPRRGRTRPARSNGSFAAGSRSFGSQVPGGTQSLLESRQRSPY